MSRPFDAKDAWLLGAGTHSRLWEVLGAHRNDGRTTFRVWAPDADAVSVVGDGNGWTVDVDRLEPDPSGVWRGTFDGYEHGDRYKYSITGRTGHHRLLKADPLAVASELAPATASLVWESSYRWDDERWMAERAKRHRFDAPISIYEVHLGSWRYEPGGYRRIGRQLADYCVDMGFSHVELLPVMEHPFYGSWGYQTTCYFAPTARYGQPDDFRALIDTLHQAGIGVILDWVPSHFAVDDHGLGMFDGSHLYEHADPRQGFHPDWKSYVFNYDRPEVRSFLLSSAHYWLDSFHADGLRVDAVASMLYLDYSRDDGEWIPNEQGGKENLGAIELLRELNRSVYAAHPDVMQVAEESTAWPGVTNPVDAGGLGFGFKWDMGWMNDTLSYFRQDPVHRSWHHDTMMFRSVYASAEHYVLPLSHDEVVHGKRSLLDQMPGDHWQRFANLRLLLGHQWTAPGKKLLFMGSEFASPQEWSHEAELPWGLLGDEYHAGMQGWVRRLNEVYADLPALYRLDRDPDGFQWVVGNDREQSVVAYLRKAPEELPVLVVMNNTPIPRPDYQVGVAEGGPWRLVANSDDHGYGGAGWSVDGSGQPEKLEAEQQGLHGFDHSLRIDLPPLALVVLTPG